MFALPYVFSDEKLFYIQPLKKRDLNECFKIVSKRYNQRNLKQNMNSYINAGNAVGVKDSGKLIAFAFWFIGQNGVSLTHFYIDEFYRKKPFWLWFYTQILLNFEGKRVFVHSKDVWEYKSIAKPTKIKDEYEIVLPNLKVVQWVKP
ncbi:hypothetical protein U5B43_02860 [Campylobacter sp. 9BO]|uniref:hypothetical protein n=1 Tax=Campylobacter sp. 9BO TaxID=3424759 RepID=UPI003D33816B